MAKQASRWKVANQNEVAEFFGLSINTVQSWAKQGMPGGRGSYRLDLIAQWLRKDGPWQRWDKTTTGPNDDPLLDGDSPALERYRLAKAKHAELDLDLRRGELIEVSRWRDMMIRWSVGIRRMGERLSKRYGNDAAITVNETLEECSSIAEAVTRE